MRYLAEDNLKSLGPYVGARLRTDQLRGYCRFSSSLAHAALYDIAYTESPSSLYQIALQTSVPITTDHEAPGQTGQIDGYILRHAL